VAYGEDGSYTRVGADYVPPGTSLPGSDILNSNTSLFAGDHLDCNGYMLTMQGDGNLVLYAGETLAGRYYPYRGAIWSSGTAGYPGSWVSMQSDGNLVIYSASSVPLWNTATHGNPGAKLYLQNDGNVVIYSSGGVALWNTNTYHDTSIGATPFIPIVDESVDMFDYNATLNGNDDRSEIIIGTDLPDPKDPSRTGFVRHVPPNVNLRGIERTAIWVSQIFQNSEEAELMAELIAIHAWFAQRMGSVSCVANPCLSLDDQVRLVERNTNETYIHRITGIDSQMDLDAGTWDMSLTTHWLGTADNWVITREPADGSSPYVVISERLDRWQSETNRGLGEGGVASSNVSRLVLMTGNFETSTSTVGNEDPIWGVTSESYLDFGEGDLVDTQYVNLFIDDNGIEWPA